MAAAAVDGPPDGPSSSEATVPQMWRTVASARGMEGLRSVKTEMT
jgi:hypothetical protein